MTILITGGSGFVGLNIAATLLDRGESVTLFDINQPPPVAETYLRSLPGSLFIETGDICDGVTTANIIKRYEINKLVHGAAVTAGPEREIVQSRRIFDVNLGGTIETLEAALSSGVSRVVQLGTGSIFGAKTKIVNKNIEEDETTPVPDSLYGISKYAAERTALRYREKRGLDIVVARLGVVFGPWEYGTGVRDTLSIPYQLLHAAEAGEFVRLRQTLPDDWIYVKDVANAVVALLDLAITPNPIYQLATGSRWSIPDWCELLKQRYPTFDYMIVSDDEPMTIGDTAPFVRPPFSVERLQRDTSFVAKYGAKEAFEDHLRWRDAMLKQPLDLPGFNEETFTL